MYNSNCVRCRNARTAGYDGCAVHNIGRRRYTAPTVVVVDNHRHTSPVVVVEDCSPAVGVDVATGDAVLNLGGGLGVDMRTGDLEVNLGGGAYVDVDRGSSWDSGPVDTGSDWGSSDW